MTYQIEQTSGAVVAAETQDAVTTLDTALLAQLRLCGSMIEVNNGLKLPIASSQRVLHSITQGISSLVSTRSNITAVIRDLTIIKNNSNLQETSFGCTEPIIRPSAKNASNNSLKITQI